jgi:hypothetical protein
MKIPNRASHHGLRRLLPYLLFLVPSVVAADWPHWRGPNHDGKADAGGVFGDQPFALELAWARPLGIAYSGISIADGRAVTMYSDGSQDYLVALDATSGEELWRRAIDAKFPAKGGSEGGASSVPAIDEGIVYAVGPMGHLLAVRLDDGSEVSFVSTRSSEPSCPISDSRRRPLSPVSCCSYRPAGPTAAV